MTFSFVATISVILLAIHETAINDTDTLYDTAKAIWITSSQMSPAWVVFSLILAELGDWTMVLAEAFREHRRNRQAQQVRESVARNQAKWEAWNDRRLEAEKSNLPFDEPPPSLEDSTNGSVA